MREDAAVTEDAGTLIRPVARALLDRSGIDRFRRALDGYTVAGLAQLLGPVGSAALSRSDLDGVRRALPAGERLSTLVSLFLLGRAVTDGAARDALEPLPLDVAVAAGLVEVSGDSVRALVQVRPHAVPGTGPQSWVVSDLGSDVRPGPMAADHVLGVGPAALTLAQRDGAHPGRPRVGRRDRLRHPVPVPVHPRVHGDRDRHLDARAAPRGHYRRTQRTLVGPALGARCWTRWPASSSTSWSPTRRSWSPPACGPATAGTTTATADSQATG